ncbi:MAG: hypothetical protein RL430_2079 [Actinomycetota bacterium]
MAEFSLHLTDDQLQIKDWIHEFAKDVMRPAAQEWDDREEFPWPVVQEAAKIGLYGIEFMMNAMGDSSGLTLPVAIEEIFWGDAGLGMAIMGSGLAAAGITGNGTPEQIMEWVPQCYGTADDIKLGAFCVSEPDAGSDVSSLRTRAVYDEATDEWVLNGTKAWITNGGIADVHVVVAAVDPALKGRGQASFIVPPKTKGLSQGQKYKKHGIKASHTAEVVLDDVRIPGRCLLGGKEKLDAKLARAREARSGTPACPERRVLVHSIHQEKMTCFQGALNSTQAHQPPQTVATNSACQGATTPAHHGCNQRWWTQCPHRKRHHRAPTKLERLRAHVPRWWD